MRNVREVCWAIAAALLVAAAAAGLATAEKPVRSTSGKLAGLFNVGLSRKVLSKSKPTPVSLSLSGKISNP
jgi:hypothetical protein